ncbi:YfbU domain superfamily [Verrucomicrobiia bacterium DG1235]|nr:YfbU domain superfamily [Verrucomicrobiae bacterium DG1235]
MKLDQKERLQLANQFKILAALYPDERSDYEKNVKILESGYEWHYDSFVEYYYDGLSTDECKFVVDVLDMHRSLKNSFYALKDKGDLTPEDIRFSGFDGNHETELMAYAEFFVRDLGRFEEFMDVDFNSHTASVGRYQEMLSILEKHSKANRNNLSLEDIKEVILK